jgi:hypothetical protein
MLFLHVYTSTAIHIRSLFHTCSYRHFMTSDPAESKSWWGLDWYGHSLKSIASIKSVLAQFFRHVLNETCLFFTPHVANYLFSLSSIINYLLFLTSFSFIYLSHTNSLFLMLYAHIKLLHIFLLINFSRASGPLCQCWPHLRSDSSVSFCSTGERQGKMVWKIAMRMCSDVLDKKKWQAPLNKIYL